MRIFLPILTVLLLFVTRAVAETQIDPSAAHQKITAGAILVDVRSAEEFSTGHLSGALNIPHDRVAEQLAQFGSDKDKEIVLYCRTGRRASLAAAVLEAHGFKHVLNAGGYSELQPGS